MTEEQLIARAQAGEGDAFALLVEPYRTALAGTAYLMVRDTHLVEDAVQEALVQIWRGFPSYRHEGSLRAWLMTVLVNQVRKMQRKRLLPTTPLEEAAESVADLPGPEEEAVRNDERRRVRETLAALSEEHREVVALRYYADLSVPEIARALGVAEGTIKSRLSRALDRLEGLLSQAESRR